MFFSFVSSSSSSFAAPPSAPRELKAEFVNETTVTLTWKQPEYLGGRSDLFYDVKCSVNCEKSAHDYTDCSESCDDTVVYSPGKEGLNVTGVTAAKLLSFTRYNFTVYSRNRVSKIAWKTARVTAQSSVSSVRTKESGELSHIISLQEEWIEFQEMKRQH